MDFPQTLVEGTLIRRNKKFLADIKLRNGAEITAHCAHPGSMMGCSEPGSKVLLSVNDDTRRRFKHQLEIIYVGRVPVGVHMYRPQIVVQEALSAGKITELLGYARLKRIPKVPREIDVDFILDGNGLRTCHVVVFNVTLAHEKIAYYPDIVSEEALTYLAKLTDLVREGKRAMAFFLAQRVDVEFFKPAEHIDATFAQALRDAVARGVEVVGYRAKVSRKGIELDKGLKTQLLN